jgi:hypothetical protein
MTDDKSIPTPRTDAFLLEINEGRVYITEGPIPTFCRQLEIELTASADENKRLREEVADWEKTTQVLYKELKDAGQESSQLRAQIEALKNPNRCPNCHLAYTDDDWQPIETAPKDGTEILAWRKDCGILLIRWDAPINFCRESECESIGEEAAEAEDWFCADFDCGSRLEGSEIPTLWMPKPNEPVDTAINSSKGETTK